jgi:hypothetical protein
MERLEFDLLVWWFVGLEEDFGWMKTIAGQEKTKFKGQGRVGWAFIFAAVYSLMRLLKLVVTPTWYLPTPLPRSAISESMCSWNGLICSA